MDGIAWGESKLQYINPYLTEYVIHLIHSHCFSTLILQDILKENDEFVEYTYLETPYKKE